MFLYLLLLLLLLLLLQQQILLLLPKCIWSTCLWVYLNNIWYYGGGEFQCLVKAIHDLHCGSISSTFLPILKRLAPLEYWVGELSAIQSPPWKKETDDCPPPTKERKRKTEENSASMKRREKKTKSYPPSRKEEENGRLLDTHEKDEENGRPFMKKEEETGRVLLPITHEK